MLISICKYIHTYLYIRMYSNWSPHACRQTSRCSCSVLQWARPRRPRSSPPWRTTCSHRARGLSPFSLVGWSPPKRTERHIWRPSETGYKPRRSTVRKWGRLKCLLFDHHLVQPWPLHINLQTESWLYVCSYDCMVNYIRIYIYICTCAWCIYILYWRRYIYNLNIFHVCFMSR